MEPNSQYSVRAYIDRAGSMYKKSEAMCGRLLEDPDDFCGEAAQNIDWYKNRDKDLDDSNRPLYRWFQGCELNTCDNALDRHLDSGRADQLALIDEVINGDEVIRRRSP